MAKNKVNLTQQLENKFNLKLISTLIFILSAKFIWILTTKGTVLGADGENYLQGVNAILGEGMFSKNETLLVWPAGYPMFIVLLAKINLNLTLYSLAIFQTAIFTLSIYMFCKELFRTKLSRISLVVALFISLNPTLSLSNNVIGYESLTASGYLIISAIILRDLRVRDESNLTLRVILVATILSIMSAFQPRLILSFIIILIWLFVRRQRRSAALLSALALVITLVLPGLLIVRNMKANNLATISNNLGYTMNIGAGPSATGGYMGNAKGVPCTKDRTDSQLVICVLKWELNNPGMAFRQAINRALFFWSPWYGPAANGTMARNPWINIHPVKVFVTSQERFNFVWGIFGKSISWFLMLSQLFLLIFGVSNLWKMGGNEKIFGLIAITVVSLSWLVSIFTIGDHRFRIPIMGLSLFLQIVGLNSLLMKLKKV